MKIRRIKSVVSVKNCSNFMGTIEIDYGFAWSKNRRRKNGDAEMKRTEMVMLSTAKYGLKSSSWS